MKMKIGQMRMKIGQMRMRSKFFSILTVLLFLSCSKDEPIIAKTVIEPKKIFNNTTNWNVAKYIESGIDSTKILSKFWVSFNEDPTCAERIIFKQLFLEVWAIWETYDYADGTVIKFWIPEDNVCTRLQGEWYFNRLTSNEIYLFRDNQQLIFKR